MTKTNTAEQLIPSKDLLETRRIPLQSFETIHSMDLVGFKYSKWHEKNDPVRKECFVLFYLPELNVVEVVNIDRRVWVPCVQVHSMIPKKV